MSKPAISRKSRWIAPILVLACGITATLSLRPTQAAPQDAPAATPTPGLPANNDQIIQSIRTEGLNHSQVMQTLDYLCNVIGGRLTGSPEAKHANDWTRDQLEKWGLQNAHLEKWGPFGKGWSVKRFAIQITDPTFVALKAFPKAWSPGFDKPFDAPVVYLDVQTDADFEKYRGKLKGAVVLIGGPRNLIPAYAAPATRYADPDLARASTVAAGTDLGAASISGGYGGPRGRGPAPTGGPGDAAVTPPALTQRGLAFAAQEGAAMEIESSTTADGEILSVQSAAVPQAFNGGGGRRGNGTGAPAASTNPTTTQAAAPGGGRRGGGSVYGVNTPSVIPQITMALEDYNRLVRMCKLGQKLTMSVDFKTEFQTADTYAYNTIAEIPGTDLKDQIVMVGAHMDSWPAGTGATDNGAGCGAALEAVRIISALHLQPRRTIRVALWTGEEEGLLGSAAYVREHFGSRAGVRGGGGGGGGGRGAAGPLTKGPEYDNLSVYFNLDNGTGKVRGIFAQGDSAAGPIFQDWLKPFADLGANTVTLGNTGSTDHISFDGIGLPGFQFIQDPIDYINRTHHTNADVYDRLQGEDMKASSTIIAAFLWNAANMNDRFPRKPQQ